MTTILIIAHAPLASALKAVAQHTYPDCAQSLEVLDVSAGADVDQIEASARALMRTHGGAETLIFVDVFGASPCNAAMRLLDNPRTRVVAGVNVPMLWRTLCYDTNEPLDALVARAVAGAAQGVMPVTVSRPQNQSQRAGTHDSADCQDQQ
ncbi:MAG: PTS sugar transporter subunit IIA [Rubrivivax sp.]